MSNFLRRPTTLARAATSATTLITSLISGCSANEPASTPQDLTELSAGPGGDPSTPSADGPAASDQSDKEGATAPLAGADTGGAAGIEGNGLGAMDNATPDSGGAGPAGAAGQYAGDTGDASATTNPGEDIVGPPRLTVIVTAGEGLNRPSDLEFNPYVDDQLWVINHGDASTIIIEDATGADPTSEQRTDPEAKRHFMPSPTALAFGGRETTLVDADQKPVEGTFATCPEVETDFMGPTLWTSDLRIFALSKNRRQPPFNGPDTGREGPGSHIDMLHRTPSCAGIAWTGRGSEYWTYSGTRALLVRYDFGQDHGIGNTDHSDGSVWRYEVEGLRYVKDVPSHLAFASSTGLLYIADGGNGRIVTFDPSSATENSAMSDGDNVDELAIAMDMRGGELTELIPPDYGLILPSGLEIHNNRLYVSDPATSSIHKFALDGTPLSQIDLPEVMPSGLAGLAFGPDGKLYLVDMVGNRVMRLENRF